MNKKGILIALMAMAILVSGMTPAFAGGANVILQDGTKMSYGLYNKLQNNPNFSVNSMRTYDAVVNKTTFDFVVSYYDIVSDDVYIDAHFPSEKSARRNRALQVEEAFKYLNDALWEATNKQHHLGKITIVQSGDRIPEADIHWLSEVWPNASLGGYGMGLSGAMRIQMGDIFPNPKADEPHYIYITNDPASNRRWENADAGYTMAHEFGHFVYLLYDEYKTMTGDKVTNGSTIMNYQWGATSANSWNWLNFSTKLNYDSTTEIDQKRIYGKSCWETLSTLRQPDEPFVYKPRVSYKFAHVPNSTGLTVADSDYIIDYTANLPRDYVHNAPSFTIEWIATNTPVVHQIVFDKTGSMAGEPLIQAKAAAIAYIMGLNPDVSYLGIVVFDDTAEQKYPITKITKDNANTVKEEAVKVINALSASGTTAIWDAADKALTNMQGFLKNGVKGYTVLVTDGEDNSSKLTLSQVISKYNNSDAVTNTIGFGSFIFGEELTQLAELTGGKYYYASTQAGEIQKVLQYVYNDVLGAVNIARIKTDIGSGGSYKKEVEIDSVVNSIIFTMQHNGAPANAVINILDPSGAPVPTSDYIINQVGSTTTYTVFAKPISGRWTINAKNNSSNTLGFNCMVNRKSSKKPEEYTLTISTTRAENTQMVTVRQDEVLQLIICKGSSFLTGFDVVKGAVYDVNSKKVMDVEFMDNGDKSKGDAKAKDGIYSTVVRFPEKGLYNIEVDLDEIGLPIMETNLAVMPPKGGLDSFMRLGEPFKDIFSRTALLSVVADSSVLPMPRPSAVPNYSAHDDDDHIPDDSGSSGCNAVVYGYGMLALAAMFLRKRNLLHNTVRKCCRGR